MIIEAKRKGKIHKVLIDDEDYNSIKKFLPLYILKPNKIYYAAVSINRKLIYLHRILMDAKKGQIVDHENRNGLDCHRVNMRFVTRSGNNRNVGKKKIIGLKGAYKIRNHGGQWNGRWYSRMQINYKDKYLGSFDTEQEAHEAYNIAYENQIKLETE